eukprot:9494134-Pyramimonas_sp.AAC.1
MLLGAGCLDISSDCVISNPVLIPSVWHQRGFPNAAVVVVAETNPRRKMLMTIIQSYDICRCGLHANFTRLLR